MHIIHKVRTYIYIYIFYGLESYDIPIHIEKRTSNYLLTYIYIKIMCIIYMYISITLSISSSTISRINLFALSSILSNDVHT